MTEQAIPDLTVFRLDEASMNITFIRSITLNISSSRKEINENPFNKSGIISFLYIDEQTNGLTVNNNSIIRLQTQCVDFLGK
jgi:hypothetical protein